MDGIDQAIGFPHHGGAASSVQYPAASVAPSSHGGAGHSSLPATLAHHSLPHSLPHDMYDDEADRGGVAADADRAVADCSSQEDDSLNSFVRQFDAEGGGGGKWQNGGGGGGGGVGTKDRYKTDLLSMIMTQFENTDGSRATIDQLKEFGITVYLAEHDSVDLSLLRQVVRHVAASKSDPTKSRYENQRCLLYRDENGRLFNLTLDNGASGLAGTWKGISMAHSGTQAVAALAILTRAYACANVSGAFLHPGILATVLGLTLHEEMSHVWLNLSLLVRGTPSVAAHTLLSGFDSDWPRKLAILALALGASMGGKSDHRRYCTLVGIGLAMILLAANLGSRAWHHMKWKPISNSGGTISSILAPAISLFVATITGLIFPFMGFGRIQAGGKAAVQLVVFNSIIVALLFVASDLDIFKQLMISGGSDPCDQDSVNITLGIWLTMTSITCIFAAKKVGPSEPHPEDGDPILVEDHASPVGYVVPNFPNFAADPVQFGGEGLSFLNVNAEIAMGLLVSIGVGALVVSNSLYDFVGDANEYIPPG